MTLFTTDNTEGYTNSELTKLNNEWSEIVSRDNLEEFTDEYNTAEKTFTDAVARRMDVPGHEKYRFDQYDSAYEYDQANNAYLFIGKLNGRTKKQFIKDHELPQWDEDYA